MSTATQTRTRRPGWPEIAVGVLVMALVGYGLPITLARAGIDDRVGPVVYGLFLAALSGVAGLIAFAVAARIRTTPWERLGLRRTTARWLLIGVAGGVVALILSRLAAVVYLALTGPEENIQQPYTDAAGTSVFTLILSLLFLAVLTPIGEEFLFRGVITTALLRYGAVAGVLGSAVIFALMHGLNVVFLTALMVGLVAAELRRRSDSIWPAVIVHVTNNLIGQILALTLAGVA